MKLNRIGEWVEWDEDEWIIPGSGACLMIDASCYQHQGFRVLFYKAGGPEDHTCKLRRFETKTEALDFVMAIMRGTNETP